MRMQMQIESDLHVEFMKSIEFPQRVDGARYLLLAGDICPIKQADKYEAVIAHCAKEWERTFVVAGNHEYYGSDIDNGLAQLRAICATHMNVHFLQQDRYFLDEKTVILGCTLWSDTTRPVQINDYRAIRRNGHRITHHDTREWHKSDLAWLTQAIAEERQAARRIIVLTHHLPSFQMVAPAWRDHPINLAFASALDELVAQTQLWVCGHTHTPMQIKLGDCLCIANPHGYPGETEPTKHVVEI